MKSGFSKETQQAINSLPFKPLGGYLNSPLRNPTFDAILEKHLKSQNLKPNGIALWLSSTTARHLMDNITPSTTPSEFNSYCKKFTKYAFLEITIWNHPDHTGSLASYRKLLKYLQSSLKKLNHNL